MGFEDGMYMAVVVILLSSSSSWFQFSIAVDTITSEQPIRDSEVIVSKSETFNLGFFSPENSSFRYVGIWYKMPIRTVVWVANRDKPLKDSSGVVTVSDAGNLVVLNGMSEILWSSEVSRPRPNSSAQLLDSGNLILRDEMTGLTIWESFQEPCDSMLPNMKLSIDATTGEKVMLRSWKSPSDPSIGSFSLGIDHPNVPEAFIWNGSEAYWRSGPWNGKTFIGILYMANMYLDGFSVVDDKQGTVSLSYTVGNKSEQYSEFLNSEGRLIQKYWVDGMDDWDLSWSSLESDCDVYGKCGEFGICSPEKSPICSCLKGFEPKNIAEWNGHNWTGGCIRKTPLQCESGGKEDGFLQLNMVKVPDFAEWSAAFDEGQCRNKCFNNCSCIAYAHDPDMGCLSWSRNLIDIQQFFDGGARLYLRVPYSELDEGTGKKVVIIITVIIGTITIIGSAYLAWKWMAKRRVMKGRSKGIMLVNRGEETLEFSDEYMLGSNMCRLNRDLQVVKYYKVEAATNYFGIKLGEGGFGQVYKGMWQDGQEIAVKRLLKSSGQGVEEFMTEVEVISKLQHRNLVTLLGCCIQGDEKMLIYEYMANGSLDKILFDPRRREVLDWRKRFVIIEGIGRGLLYLHRDSRLRIIHRDIKASNILLDEQLNPKISDFGTARIFSGNEDKVVNTSRVVGTYGYMSPEYAMDGRFSEKSDVFSFGVLLLEIVSGRRNNSFYEDEEYLSLLAFAWKLWNEDNIVAFVDPMICNHRFEKEFKRCLHVGLLCVQELAKDRPTMSTAVSMLNSEIAHLPSPKQPAFTQQSQQSSDIGSITFTTVQGR